MSDWTKIENKVIVDVRTPAEFNGGHVEGSVNIPLQEISGHLEDLLQVETLVFCCASGGRSGTATQLLVEKGHGNVYNGGSWLAVNDSLNA
ncbi:MAG TPA: rhodanese-like domain-containing protein [Fluviicola sp.]|nr:rhodanese-like domain-containing protein [Fluviicola sp.]